MRPSQALIAGLSGVIAVASYACYGHHQSGWPGHMMDYGYGYGGVIMWIGVLLLLGLVIYLVWVQKKTEPGKDKEGEDPLIILKQRYARGEITKEESDRVKKDLEE
ncbi:MAG: SHOCT domain-containing protein [bacterium]